MMDYQLTVRAMLDRAVNLFPHEEIVTKQAEKERFGREVHQRIEDRGALATVRLTVLYIYNLFSVRVTAD